MTTLALSAGQARAACDASGNPSPAGSFCYKLLGSDTLYDIMTLAITQARSTATNGGNGPLATQAADLYYLGTGSGNAESAMSKTAAGVTGLGSQSIGPMSRNFRPKFIDVASSTFFQRTAAALTNAGHMGGCGTLLGGCGWWPNAANVAGLDGAIIVVKNTSALENVSFLTKTDNAIPVTAFDKAEKNNINLPFVQGNPVGFNNISAACLTYSGTATNPPTCGNYNNLLGVILSGVDGSGTYTACADPRRVQAVQDMAGLLGVSTINHFIRRDENSGTTDTFKDRIMVVANTSDTTRYPLTGGRFCNGASVGGINGATAQQGICTFSRTTACTSNSSCSANTCSNAAGTGTCSVTGAACDSRLAADLSVVNPCQINACAYNLNNPDYDPIRRPCMAVSGTALPTSCTDLTTGLPCLAADGNPNCTQGLVVALSDADPGSADITVSIGNRVGSSTAGEIIGFAGKEAATAANTKGLAINTHKATEAKVRTGTYLLSRRLFIQNTNVNSANSFDVADDSQGGGGGDQVTKEQALFNDFLTNRTLMDPIVKKYGFITCDAPGNNDLCEQLAGPVPGALGNLPPVGTLSPTGGNGNGGTWAMTYDGRVPVVVTTGTVGSGTGVDPGGWSQGRACTAAATCACSAATPCLTPATTTSLYAAASGAQCITGRTATATGCPAIDFTVPANKLPAWAPCSLPVQCASGVCADRLGTGVPGETHDLYCN